jgi:hypothetical protein
MILIRHHYNSDDDDDGVYISSPISKYSKTTNENTNNSNTYYDNTSSFYDNSSNTKHFNYAPHRAHDNDNDHK